MSDPRVCAARGSLVTRPLCSFGGYFNCRAHRVVTLVTGACEFRARRGLEAQILRRWRYAAAHPPPPRAVATAPAIAPPSVAGLDLSARVRGGAAARRAAAATAPVATGAKLGRAPRSSSLAPSPTPYLKRMRRREWIRERERERAKSRTLNEQRLWRGRGRGRGRGVARAGALR